MASSFRFLHSDVWRCHVFECACVWPWLPVCVGFVQGFSQTCGAAVTDVVTAPRLLRGKKKKASSRPPALPSTLHFPLPVTWPSPPGNSVVFEQWTRPVKRGQSQRWCWSRWSAPFPRSNSQSCRWEGEAKVNFRNSAIWYLSIKAASTSTLRSLLRDQNDMKTVPFQILWLGILKCEYRPVVGRYALLKPSACDVVLPALLCRPEE